MSAAYGPAARNGMLQPRARTARPPWTGPHALASEARSRYGWRASRQARSTAGAHGSPRSAGCPRRVSQSVTAR